MKKLIIAILLISNLAGCAANYFAPQRLITKDEIESIQLSGMNDISLVLKTGEIGQVCRRDSEKKGYYCLILK